MELRKLKVFISYSRKDSHCLADIIKHIKVLNFNRDLVDIWHDKRIEPGKEWEVEIIAAIQSSQVAVLLISANFLTSDFIKQTELPILLKRKQDYNLEFIPILLNHCRLETAEQLISFQFFNATDTPLMELSENQKEGILKRLADKLYEFCENHIAFVPTDAEPVSSHLPTINNPYFGREKEMKRAKDLITQQRAGVLTLHGTGGIGKTRFACQLALSLANRFPGNCRFIDLSKHHTVDGLCMAVSEALGAYATHKEEGPEKVGYLLSKLDNALFILDNFEQLCHLAKVTIEAWRRRCPQVYFIVTSRTVLGIEEEHVLKLPPLVEPPSGVNSVAEIERSESYQFFMYHAHRNNPELEISEQDTKHIARIIKLLEGHPKAMILVACRIGKIDLEQIVEDLTERILAGREGEELQNSINFSYGLLSEDEKTVFQCACIFNNGFDMAAAKAIIPIHSQTKVDPIIEQLYNHSLINIIPFRGKKRYSMYRPLQEYGQALLTEKADNGTHIPTPLGLEYARYYLAYAEKWNALIPTSGVQEALDYLESERENILNAHLWCLNAGQVALAAQLILAYSDTLALRGPWRLRKDRILKTLNGLENTAQNAQPVVSLHTSLSYACSYLGDAKAASENAQLAIQKARTLSDAPHLLAGALYARATHAKVQGQNEEALTLFGESRILFESIDDERNAALCEANTGYMHKALGNYDRALGHLKAAKAVIEETGDVIGLANCANWMGLTYWHQGKNEEALACFQEAAGIDQVVQDNIRLGGRLTNMGLTLIDLERYEEAMQKFQQADTIHKDYGNRAWGAVNLSGWGYAQAFTGALKEGLKKISLALKDSKDANAQSDVAHHYTNQGHAYWLHHKFPEARDSFTKAIDLQKKIKEQITRRFLFNLVYLSHSYVACNQFEEAAEPVAQAIGLRKHLGVSAADSSVPMQKAMALLDQLEHVALRNLGSH